jgi:hypothetical protein
MPGSRVRGAALLVGVLLLSGCGGSAKVTEKNSPQALACRKAIAARITAAYADAKPGEGAPLAMQRALAGKKPKECDNIDDALGVQLIAELGSEHDQMMADLAASASPTPMAMPHH